MKTEEEYKAEVLQLMRDLYPTLKGEEKERAECLFPELKEKEDERIREELILLFQDCIDNINHPYNASDSRRWIAWLEKKGEQKFADGTFVNVDDVREDFVQEVYRVLDADSTNDRANQIIDAFDNLPTVVVEKHGENKPTDKVEPKFKVKYAGSEYNVLEVKDIAGVTFYGIEDEPNHIDYVKAENCEIISGYAIKENGSPYPTKPVMFSEQPRAWSEEDEIALGDALWCCKQAASIAKDENEMGNVWYAERWLKSLKAQTAWKPSDEQIKAVRLARSFITDDFGENPTLSDVLVELEKQLKKLREE